MSTSSNIQTCTKNHKIPKLSGFEGFGYIYKENMSACNNQDISNIYILVRQARYSYNSQHTNGDVSVSNAIHYIKLRNKNSIEKQVPRDQCHSRNKNFQLRKNQTKVDSILYPSFSIQSCKILLGKLVVITFAFVRKTAGILGKGGKILTRSYMH